MMVSWTAMKQLIILKPSVDVQYIEDTEKLYVFAVDAGLTITCEINKNLQKEDLADFENNHKSSANKNLTPPRDSDRSLINRDKHTKTGWHYEPRSLDFTTSKLNSLYNRKHDGAGIMDGTDYGDGLLKFYDGTGAELVQGDSETDNDFQTRLTNNCIKTIMDWQSTYDFDIIGGYFMIKNAPTTDAYLWVIVAPDLTEEQGGSIPHISGGWNLSFFQDKQSMSINGRGAKNVAYDPVYNTNKFRMICKHAAGAEIGIQMIYEHFKA